MQDPEKEGQTEKQIKNQNQKTPRGHSSKQAKPVYIPTGYEKVYEAVGSLQAEGRPITELTTQERIKQLEEEEDKALYLAALREIQDQQDYDKYTVKIN